jgi:uncharacterized protein with HEPN domain
LWDISSTAREIATYVAGRTWREFESDGQLRRAAERCIEIIGEAARNVSAGLQEEHPEIEWRAIAAQRHILAHEYGRIDARRIWRVATVHVPELAAAVDQILAELP